MPLAQQVLNHARVAPRQHRVDRFHLRVKPVVSLVANRHDGRHAAGRLADFFGQLGNLLVARDVLGIAHAEVRPRLDDVFVHINAGDAERPEKIALAAFVHADARQEQLGIQQGFVAEPRLLENLRFQQELDEFLLEPEILKQAQARLRNPVESRAAPAAHRRGRKRQGRFFRAALIAGVYVNESVIKAWADLGVRDSKNISSDKKISELAEKIRKTPGCVTTVVPVGNEAYNRLYAKMKSVNAMLAWGHARVIENLLGQRHRMNPPPVKAISDQFAASKSVIEKALMAQGRELQLVQRHKAEEDIAVAAASILGAMNL